LAGGAQAPEGHLGLVDEEALRVAGLHARGAADGAVDVGRGAAGAADQVVVVVADARLVAHGLARRLDAAGERHAVQRLADVVGGLRGDRDAVGADALDELIDAGMVV
jgi:hypothetical protein